MALEKAELQPSSSWFLTARGGDVRLRVRDEIRIGEDDSGDLILNPPPQTALVVCSVTSGRLKLLSRAGLRFVRRDGRRSVEFDVQPGQALKLVLPHNNVQIQNEGTDGRQRMERVELLQADTAAPIQAPRRNALTRPIDAVTEAGDASGIPTLTLLQRVDISELHQLIPQRPTDDQSGTDPANALAPILVRESLLNEPDQQETQPAAADRTELASLLQPVRSLGGSSVPLLVLCLLTLVLVAADETVLETTGTAARALTATSPAGESLILLASSASTLTGQNPATADVSPSVADRHSADSSAPPQANPEPTPAAPGSTAAAPRGTDPGQEPVAEVYVQELARARRLFNAGKIITPLDNNAVRAVRWILNSSPEYQQAQLLLDQCADRLLSQASSAYASGEEYQARNLVEEVLAFNPQYAPAEELWGELSASE